MKTSHCWNPSSPCQTQLLFLDKPTNYKKSFLFSKDTFRRSIILSSQKNSLTSSCHAHLLLLTTIQFRNYCHWRNNLSIQSPSLIIQFKQVVYRCRDNTWAYCWLHARVTNVFFFLPLFSPKYPITHFIFSLTASLKPPMLQSDLKYNLQDLTSEFDFYTHARAHTHTQAPAHSENTQHMSCGVASVYKI